MIIKKLAITAAAGAIMLASAAGVFASDSPINGGSNTFESFNTTKNFDITKNWSSYTMTTTANINNKADVNNMVYTSADTGGNTATSYGGDAYSLTKATTGNAWGDIYAGSGSGGSTGGSATGGNSSGDANAYSLTKGGNAGSWISTGNAEAGSTVTNVVNTSLVHF